MAKMTESERAERRMILAENMLRCQIHGLRDFDQVLRVLDAPLDVRIKALEELKYHIDMMIRESR